MLIENETFFKHVIQAFKHNKSYENVVANTIKKGEYANSLNMLSISLLLGKTIYCFVESINKSNNVKHIYSLRTNDYPIVLLGCYNEHFFPLLTRENEKIYFKTCIDLNEYNFNDRFISFENEINLS